MENPNELFGQTNKTRLAVCLAHTLRSLALFSTRLPRLKLFSLPQHFRLALLSPPQSPNTHTTTQLTLTSPQSTFLGGRG